MERQRDGGTAGRRDSKGQTHMCMRRRGRGGEGATHMAASTTLPLSPSPPLPLVSLSRRPSIPLSLRPLPKALILSLFSMSACSILGCEREQAAPGPSASAPDVILITLDTVRTQRIGCYGYHRPITPNLDAFAAASTRFTNAVTPMPLTAPAHATMMTGLYPPEHGVIENAALLMGGPATLAERLHGAGYATVSAVGVSFLAEFGMERGFDAVDREFNKGYERHADRVTAAAIARLDQPRGQPLFLWAHYYDPHNPYRPPPKYLPILREQGVPKTEREWQHVEDRLRAELRSDYTGPDPRTFLLEQYAYDGEIQFMDAQVGALIDHLKASGRYDDALVIIVGDHGEAFGEHPGDVQHGTRLYETTMHVPWMIKLPGQTQGRVTGVLVTLVDLMPTVLDVLALAVPEQCSGKSLLPLLHGEPPPWPADERVVFMQRRLFRKLAAPPTQPAASQITDFDVEMVAARGPRWKLIWQADGTRELYDLQTDPVEQRNLTGAHDDRLAALQQPLMAWREDMSRLGDASQPVLSGESLKMLKTLGYVDDH